MEEGWNSPRNCARMSREQDANDKPLAEGNEDDNNKYGKDSNILDNSAPPAESIACSCPESQRASVPSC